MMPEKLIIDRNQAESIKLFKSCWNQVVQLWSHDYATVDTLDTEWIPIGIVRLLPRILLCFLRENRNFYCNVLRCWKHSIKICDHFNS